MPPMVIFKGSKVENEARDATPSGWMIHHSKSGYIHTKLFAEIGEKLVEFIKEKKLEKKGKHLLLLDSHSSHSFNLHFMCFMQGHGVEVLCFPPHCTHLMQPLDDVRDPSRQTSETQPGTGQLQEHGGHRRGHRCVFFGLELHLPE